MHAPLQHYPPHYAPAFQPSTLNQSTHYPPSIQPMGYPIQYPPHCPPGFQPPTPNYAHHPPPIQPMHSYPPAVQPMHSYPRATQYETVSHYAHPQLAPSGLQDTLSNPSRAPFVGSNFSTLGFTPRLEYAGPPWSEMTPRAIERASPDSRD